MLVIGLTLGSCSDIPPSPSPTSGGTASAGSAPDEAAVGRPAATAVEPPAPAVTGEVLYTWRDGEATRRVWLQNGLLVQPSSEDGPDDVVLRNWGGESVVARSAKHAGQRTEPVFRSEGGILMTLPGGVILVLEEGWDAARVSRFFQEQGIGSGRAEPMDFVPNAFLVETEPGFPSLTLADSLAGVEGVVIAIPNWRSEVVLQ